MAHPVSRSAAHQRRLILIRHGQTEYNRAGRMQGQLDTDLSEVGFAQARATAIATANWNVSAVYSSDLARARDTAKVLAEAWGVDVTTDPRLRETDLGLWQAGSHQEIDRDYPGQRAYWRHDPTWAPPQGESRLEVAARAASLVDELMAGDVFDGGDVVVVAHGGTIGALTAKLLGLPTELYPTLTSLGNVRWSQLIARPRFVGGEETHSVPAIDGSTVPLVPSSSEDWWREPLWMLEGWNVAAVPPGAAGGDISGNPDEGSAR